MTSFVTQLEACSSNNVDKLEFFRSDLEAFAVRCVVVALVWFGLILLLRWAGHCVGMKKFHFD